MSDRAWLTNGYFSGCSIEFSAGMSFRSSLLLRAARRLQPLLGGWSRSTLTAMTIRARVRAGRLVLDEPTDLPEGAEVELLPLDPGDWLDDTDRAALHAALRDSDADVAAGRLIDADVILKELRTR